MVHKQTNKQTNKQTEKELFIIHRHVVLLINQCNVDTNMTGNNCDTNLHTHIYIYISICRCMKCERGQ